jgi:hypothetical protein
MTDGYRAVSVILRQRRPSSIMVESSSRQGWLSVPRSVLHGADDLKLDREGGLDEEITIRVREWFAERESMA